VGRKPVGRSPTNRNVPLAVGVAGGAGVGFAVGRMMAPPWAAAMAKLAEGIVTQAALQTAAPIIGTAIIGSCSILSAIAVPATVIWMLSRKDQ
jgi:hypothetical protein